jgi:hypothetical protein
MSELNSQQNISLRWLFFFHLRQETYFIPRILWYTLEARETLNKGHSKKFIQRQVSVCLTRGCTYVVGPADV